MIHHLTKILKLLHSEGWRLVASADVSAKVIRIVRDGRDESYSLDTNSWFLLYDHDMKLDTRVEMESLTDQFAVDEIISERQGCWTGQKQSSRKNIFKK